MFNFSEHALNAISVSRVLEVGWTRHWRNSFQAPCINPSWIEKQSPFQKRTHFFDLCWTEKRDETVGYGFLRTSEMFQLRAIHNLLAYFNSTILLWWRECVRLPIITNPHFTGCLHFNSVETNFLQNTDSQTLHSSKNNSNKALKCDQFL